MAKQTNTKLPQKSTDLDTTQVNSYVSGLEERIQSYGLNFIDCTFAHVAGDRKQLALPKALLRVVKEHQSPQNEGVTEAQLRTKIIQLFLRPDFFGGEEKWNLLTDKQRKEIVKGGLTVIGPALLRSIRGQGGNLVYWQTKWASADAEQEEGYDDEDATEILASDSRITPGQEPFNPKELLLKLNDLAWLPPKILEAFSNLSVYSALDIANLHPEVVIDTLINSQVQSSTSKDGKVNQSKQSELDYLLTCVQLLSDKSGDALKLLVTPLSHNTYAPVLSKSTIKELAKIEVHKAGVGNSCLTEDIESERNPVNNGLRLLHLIKKFNQTNNSQALQSFGPNELNNLKKMFTDVGLLGVSWSFGNDTTSQDMEGSLEVMQLPTNAQTGITEDFWNEFHAIKVSYDMGASLTNSSGLQKIKDNLSKHPCSTYQNEYPPEVHPYLYNPANEKKIASLNKLVSQLNQGIQDDTISIAKIRKIYDSAAKLVYGDDTKIKWPAEWR